MTVNRYMVIGGNGDIYFQKVTTANGENFLDTMAAFSKDSQTELDFAKECQERFDNMFPDWADVLTWEMMAQEDFEELYQNKEAA